MEYLFYYTGYWRTKQLKHRKKCITNMILTQTTLMDVEINEVRSTISSGDSSLLMYIYIYVYIFFTFKISFNRKQPSRGVVGGGCPRGVQ